MSEINEMNETALPLPKQITEVLDKLTDYGYEAYIYGECVRMLIKGLEDEDAPKPDDFDVMTNAEMPRIRAIFDDGHCVYEHNLENGELIVTILGMAVSVTCYTDDGSKSGLKSELANKKAFTFDTIAYTNKNKSGETAQPRYFDPFGGIADLNKNTVNFVQSGKYFNPHDILPALAFYSSGEFILSDSAKQLINSHTGNLMQSEDNASINGVLMGKNVCTVLEEYSGVFTAVVPELKMLDGFISGDTTLLYHTFKSIGASSPILSLRYALLFHELGKPDCHSWDDNDPEKDDHFHGYNERARIYAVRIMKRLNCSDELIKETESIIENHRNVLHANQDILRDLEDEYSDLKRLLLFNCADFRANGDEKTAANFKGLSKKMFS